MDDAAADGIQLLEGRSASARVNEALRRAIERELHRHQGLVWIQAMNDDLGVPSTADYAEANRLLDEAGFGPSEPDEL